MSADIESVMTVKSMMLLMLVMLVSHASRLLTIYLL